MEFLQRAEGLVHPEHPSQSYIQDVTARAYYLKGGTENQQIAFSRCQRAVSHVTAMPWARLGAACNWIEFAIELQDFMPFL